MDNQKIRLAPRTGAQFGFTAGGVQARASANPIPYVLPWATAFMLVLLAVGIRFGLARDSLSWYWSIFTLAVYGTLTWITWRASRARGLLTWMLATGGVAAAGAWSWWVAGMEHLTWRPFVVYFGFAVVVCLGSNMMSAFRHGHGEHQSIHDRLGGALGKLRNINAIRVEGGEVKAGYQMEPGIPARQLQDAAEEFASLHGLPPDGVRILPSTTDASRGEMRLTVDNPLTKPAAWLGPSKRTGGTIMDPIVLGVRRNGAALQLHLPADQRALRNAAQIMLTGMNGSGKSIILQLLIIEFLSRGTPAEVEYWYGNSRKADQEPPWIRDGAARFESDRKGVAQMLHDLREEAPDRARILGRQGLSEWAPGCGLAFRLVILDEFADLATDLKRVFTDLMETVRSLGIVLVAGFQRASHTRVPTDARSQFGTFVCCGVADEDDAEMALPEAVLAANAQPWLWTNRQPGMCYLTAPGVPEEQWSEPARSFAPNKALMARWANFYIARRTGGSPAGADPSLEDAPALAARPGRPTAATDDDVDDVADTRDDEVLDLNDVDEVALAEEAADVLDELGAEFDEDDVDDDDIQPPHIPDEERDDIAGIDPCEPIIADGTGGMQLRLSPQMPPDQARRYVRDRFAEVFARAVGSGHTSVRFKLEEFGGDILAAVGYRSSWLDKVLREFCAEQPTWLRHADARGWYDVIAAPAGGRT